MARRSAATTYALSALAILIFLVYTFTGDGDKERPIPVPPARNTKGLNDRGVLQSLTFNEGVAARNARPSAVQLDAAHGPPIAVNRNDDHPRIPPPPPPPRAPLREGTPTREYPPALAKARLPKEPVARIPDSPPIHLPLPPVKLNPGVEETDDALRKAGQNVPKERVSDDDQIEGLVEKVESRPPVFDIAEPVEAVVPPLKEFMGKKLSPVVPPAGPRVDLKKGKWDGGWSQRFKQKVTDEAYVVTLSDAYWIDADVMSSFTAPLNPPSRFLEFSLILSSLESPRTTSPFSASVLSSRSPPRRRLPNQKTTTKTKIHSKRRNRFRNRRETSLRPSTTSPSAPSFPPSNDSSPNGSSIIDYWEWSDSPCTTPPHREQQDQQNSTQERMC